jgi:hypothetical protein
MSNYDMDELRILIYRSLSQASRRSPNDYGKTVYDHQDITEKVSYDINSHGYRSAEFDKNNEILVLGCSQTYGSGMPEEFTWPSIFSKSIDKKYSRVAVPGDSINAQVYKAFKYFEEIGNPKIVVGLFPLYRLEYSAIPEKFLSTSSWGQAEIEKISIGIAHFYQDNALKFSKAPHDPEYVLPREFSIFYNFAYIKMLEQYCESHNIKFIWSIYDNENIEINMQSTMYVLKNYLKTSQCIREFEYLKRDNSEILNEELTKNKLRHMECCKQFKGHKLYDWAADFDYKKHLGHWGIHTHQHMAELFIERYRQIQND